MPCTGIAAVMMLVMLAAPPATWAQGVPDAGTRPTAPRDALGRGTPRGALLGFMTAAQRGQLDTASLFLHTTARGAAATDLARRLYVVLNARLPARLNRVSDDPAGSLIYPLKPDQDVVAAIDTADGPLDIVMERVDVGASGRVWLFARRTLDAIPAVYEEVDLVSVDRFLPEALTRPRIAGIRLFEWLAFFVAIPVLYRAMGLAGLLLAPAQAMWRRRHGLPPQPPARLPGPFRLFLLAFTIHTLLAAVELPLLERLFWTITARIFTTAAIVWVALLLNGYAEAYLSRRLRGATEVAAMLRLARRTADAMVVLAGALVVLRYFGVDPTAALAGLGIGGIAVALAAQKTLENVIGGVSIIFDKAVRVGDFLKIGDLVGTVDSIGLRSTRIRTLDRTMLTVPNGMIASVNVETISARDKFWFHHYVPLRFETTAPQLRFIIGDVRDRMRDDRHVDAASIRARVIRFGPSSIDLELFAYLFAPTWEHFLELQEELLLDVLDIVDGRGAAIALPAHTVHLAGGLAAEHVAPAGVAGAARP
jgi:MscS family membrane protein